MDSEQSELHKLQEELENTRRKLQAVSSELENFAYVVSHDLQAPLRQISGFLGLIEDKGYDGIDAETQEYLQHLGGSGRRLSTLIDGLLQYSRVVTRAGPRVNTDCGTLFERAVQLLNGSISAHNVVIDRSNLPTLAIHPDQILYVFHAALDNAIKFNRESQPHIAVSAEQRGNTWQFSIRDNGIGIQQDKCAVVFNMFRRLHTDSEYPGHGLGLSISKRIIEHHGGEIHIAPLPNRGCNLSFSLPAPSVST